MTNNKKQKKDYATPKMKVVEYKHKTILLGNSEDPEQDMTTTWEE